MIMEDKVHRIVSRTSSLHQSLSQKRLKSRPSSTHKPSIPVIHIGNNKWSRLLFSQDFSDIYIRISSSNPKDDSRNDTEDALIPCHKLVLVVNSPFFWDLLRKSDDLDVIRFIDFSVEAVKIFLEFLYTEELSSAVWHSYEVLLHVMELAQKFEVPALRQACLDNLAQLEVNAANAFSMWQRARDFEEHEVEEIAFRFIAENAEKIISSLPLGFLELTLDNLKALLIRDDLQIEELTLFNAVFKWAYYQCEQRGYPLSSQSIRRVLKDAIYLIRFPLMATSIFTNLIIKTGILSTDEVSRIFRLMYRQENDDSQLKQSALTDKLITTKHTFGTTPRQKPGPVYTVNRFEAPSAQDKPCTDKFYSFLFSCDKSAALVGFTFFTVSPKLAKSPDIEKLTLEIQIQLQKFEGAQFTFASLHKTFTAKQALTMLAGSRKTLQLKFEYPVTIQPSTWYHVQYKIQGPATLSGNTESVKEKVKINCKGRGDVTFNFKSVPGASKEDENQLAALIFKLI